MSGLLWKLAVAGTAVAVVTAYRRHRVQPPRTAVFSQDRAFRAEPDDGAFTPPHGDVVSVTETPRGENAGLHAGPAMT
ncbi:hypothetical protein GGR77_002631 [Xanthomonas translucens]